MVDTLSPKYTARDGRLVTLTTKGARLSLKCRAVVTARRRTVTAEEIILRVDPAMFRTYGVLVGLSLTIRYKSQAACGFITRNPCSNKSVNE